MSCGIGMFGLKGAVPFKLVAGLQANPAIYSVAVELGEYTGIRVTASLCPPVAEGDYFRRQYRNAGGFEGDV